MGKKKMGFCFDGIILSDFVGYNKPHKKIFEFALQKANAQKEQTIMLGDDWEADIVGAKNFGIDQLFFNRTQYSVPFTPTYEVNHLSQIKKLL